MAATTEQQQPPRKIPWEIHLVTALTSVCVAMLIGIGAAAITTRDNVTTLTATVQNAIENQRANGGRTDTAIALLTQTIMEHERRLSSTEAEVRAIQQQAASERRRP